jgi:malonyl-CoA O-methyltransferase
MSSILRMLSSRSAAVAQSFGARADTYDEHADLQRGVAGRLARLLPKLAAPRVLELGCGTGLFSRHLLARYPDGTFLFTDLAPSMVGQCRRNLVVASEQRASYEIMDAARPMADCPFDLIATSMTLHWLADPAAALTTLRRQLTPGGVLIYATSAPKLPEWREVLEEQALPRTRNPELPGSSMRSASSLMAIRSASCAA